MKQTKREICFTFSPETAISWKTSGAVRWDKQEEEGEKKNKIKSVVLAFNLSMDGKSAMGWRETGRGKTRRKRVSNERRSRHKVNRYGPCSSQGLTALRTPRRLYFLSFSFPHAPIVPSLYQRPSLRLWLSLMLAM